MTITGDVSDLVDPHAPNGIDHLSQTDIKYLEDRADVYTGVLRSNGVVFDMTTGGVKSTNKNPDHAESRKPRIGQPLGAWVYIRLVNEDVPDKFWDYHELIVIGIHRRIWEATDGAN